ncbi:MAG: 50S ribosomal protein L22 [Dehalococcoidia bacterium]|nr:50S ribosomal protein L22 [Dehalococcoidia bacterium]
MPEVKAVSRNVGASPKRLKPIMDLVRGMKVNDALDTLGLLPSPWARVVAKTVRSASANAENNLLMDPDGLVIVKVVADQAPSLKRFRPRARGRVGRITKRSSHVTVVVDEEEVS